MNYRDRQFHSLRISQRFLGQVSVGDTFTRIGFLNESDSESGNKIDNHGKKNSKIC